MKVIFGLGNATIKRTIFIHNLKIEKNEDIKTIRDGTVSHYYER